MKSWFFEIEQYPKLWMLLSRFFYDTMHFVFVRRLFHWKKNRNAAFFAAHRRFFIYSRSHPLERYKAMTDSLLRVNHYGFWERKRCKMTVGRNVQLSLRPIPRSFGCVAQKKGTKFISKLERFAIEGEIASPSLRTNISVNNSSWFLSINISKYFNLE